MKCQIIFSGKKIRKIFKNHPAHGKTYNKTCSTREDQSVHPRGLIRVGTDRMCPTAFGLSKQG